MESGKLSIDEAYLYTLYISLNQWRYYITNLAAIVVVCLGTGLLFWRNYMMGTIIMVGPLLVWSQRVFSPARYCFDDNGIWRSRFQLARQNSRELLATSTSITNWESTNWHGLPAMQIFTISGPFLIVYPRNIPSDSRENGAVKWLNLHCGKDRF